MWVFLALVFVPLAEIALFVILGGEDALGLTNTLIIVLATAIIGSITLRTQGLNTLEKLRALKADEEAPIVLIEGLMIAAAGLLLLTPGFLTDTIGFLLLAPPVRRYLAKRAAAKAIVHFAGRPGPAPGAQRPPPRPERQPHYAQPKDHRAKPSGDIRRDAEDARILDDDAPQQKD